MIFNMAGGGGGGELNFSVVGGTAQPTNPKENTIWINTDTDITAWEFISANPTWTASSGHVYIVANTTSNNGKSDFNILKENGIWIEPTSVLQCVNGAYVRRVAKIYQGGQWVELWDGTLYKNGDTYESVTGGWYVSVSRYDGATLTTNNGSGQMVMTRGKATEGVVSTRNKIDLSGYTKLHILMYTTWGVRFLVGVTNNPTDLATYVAGKTFTSQVYQQWVEIDITNVNSGYISFQTCEQSDTAQLVINHIYLS